MAGVTGTASHINHLLWLAEAAQNQFPLRNIPLNLPQRTSRFDSSMAALAAEASRLAGGEVIQLSAFEKSAQ